MLTHALGAVLLILLAITLSEAIRPLVAQLQRIRVPRALGALLIYLALLALLVGIGWLLFDPLATQASELANRAPTYLAQAQTWIKDAQQALLADDPLSEALSALVGQALASLQSSVPSLLQFPFTLVSGVFGALLSIVLIVTISVFWLMSADKLRDFALALAPERTRIGGALLFADLGRTLGGWVRGTLVAMLLIGAFTALGLALLGVPYALLLGLLAGLLGDYSLSRPLDQRFGRGVGGPCRRRSVQGAAGGSPLSHRATGRGQSGAAAGDELGGAC